MLTLFKILSDSLATALHDETVGLLLKSNRSKDNVRAVFDYLEQHPIIDIGRTAAALDVSYNTVSSVVKKLVGLGILKETCSISKLQLQ